MTIRKIAKLSALGLLGIVFLAFIVLVVASRPAWQPERWPRFSAVDPGAVKIIRDSWGVPHIYTKTDAEAAYGLAWAHAEDDFDTIQRALAASMQVAGLLDGPQGVIMDYAVGLFQVRATLDEQYETLLSPEYRAVLNGYADGLNAYAANHEEQVLVKQFFPLRPQALAAYMTTFMIMLGGGGEALAYVFGKPASEDPEKENLYDFSGGGGANGSNAFAFAPTRMADGSTVLVINPHNPYEGPLSWYEVQIQTDEGWAIHGGTFPGLPIVPLGVTPTCGWAHTLNFPDRGDLYALEVDPNNSDRYRFDGEWREFEKFKVPLRVGLLNRLIALPLWKSAKWSVHGPVLEAPDGRVFAFRSGTLREFRAGEQWYRMGKARNFAQFRAALEMNALAGFNVVYADSAGEIFFLGNGIIPQRPSGYDWRQPVDGSTSASLWTAVYANRDLPQLHNPRAGYVFSLNTEVFAATDPTEDLRPEDFVPMGYPPSTNMNRLQRMRDFMRDRGQLSYEDVKTLKYDTKLPQNIVFPVNINAIFTLDPAQYPELAQAITLLREWDRDTDVDSIGATLWTAAHRQVYTPDPNAVVHRVYRAEETVELLRKAQEQLMRKFGRIDVPYGDYQRLERGDLSLPMYGIFDVMGAGGGVMTDEGYVKAGGGDSLIIMAQWNKDAALRLETVVQYGASSRPDSPHFNDQMQLLVAKKLKSMTMDRSQVEKNAGRTYAPSGMARRIASP